MGKILKMNRCLFFFVLTLVGCQSSKHTQEEIDAFKNEIDEWHKERADFQLSRDGWINVRGLYWLKEGINSFGTDPSNDLVFPSGSINAKAGFFILRDTVVSMELSPETKVTSESKPFSSTIIFHPDSTKVPILENEGLQWFVVKRQDKIGIRLRDFESEKLKSFKGIESYDADLDWRFNAKFVIPTGKRIEIANVLGQTNLRPVTATLTFEYGDESYSLNAIDEDGKLFVIFGDETNGKETYGSGRYLYASLPTEPGVDVVILDFNMAYNPPCAFTEFATCPLPPQQNILPFAVTAGEKAYHQ